MIPLLCETAARASQDTGFGFLTLAAGILLLVGALVAMWLGR